MENLPYYISLSFCLITILAFFAIYYTSGKSKNLFWTLLTWLLFQAIVGLAGFYKVTHSFPPRLFLMVMPPAVLILIIFLTNYGKEFIDSLSLKGLTLLHTARIGVELILFGLFVHKGIPELMTFEGRNFDILSGLTAPFVYYFGFVKNALGNTFLILWNLVCLGLVVFIVVNGILSAPSPFQQFAFEQPNVALLFFPFNWLPSFIVPLVIFSHLAALRILFKSRKGLEQR